jgi:mannitol/fructose-specific phosphotransferase system IIA component (Ntr-type)
LLSQDRIVDLISTKKDNVLKELVQVLCTSKAISNKLDFYKAISEREKMGGTDVGFGFAIPHAQSKAVSDFVIAIGRKPEGIAYESADGAPVHFVVILGAPDHKTEELMKLLAKMVLVFKNLKFRKKLIEAKSKSEIFNLFRDK